MSVDNTVNLSVEQIKPKIGSKVFADKATLLGGAHAAEIRELLEQRGVLVFPQINFTDEEQVAFTKTLGSLARERTGEEVFPISLDMSKSEGSKYLKGAFFWHFDGYSLPMPILASILSAKVIPEVGGNTDFANCYAAYDDLPGEDRKKIEALKVIHSAWYTLFSYDFEPEQEVLEAYMEIPDSELPLVWSHRSGRKSLVLGSQAHHVVDMDYKESARLLNRLREWATKEEYRYSHKWSVGDMVIWDNTGTLHRASAYDPESGRELHRTKLEGEEPITT